ncbi:MAG: helix-turn-helix domain-containing protein [Solirubrobacteraceae bacterium]
MTPGQLIRDARRSAGLSQQALATRLGTTQSTIAGLEADRSSPRVATVERALRACGRELTMTARPNKSSIDETLVFESLRWTHEQRLIGFERSYANVRELALAGARSRGELA